MSLWKELKRRNVYKVGVAYAIVAWLLIQFAAIAFPHLGFPSWAVPFVIIILIIGFPVVLIIAWAFEVTPEGIKRTKQVPLADSITHLTGQKLNYILAGVIVLAVAFILFDNYFLDRRAIEPEVATIEPEQVPAVVEVKEIPKSIAVFPFSDLSPEKDQGYFVDGLSEELLNCLAKINGLRVISRTSSFAFKDSGKTLQEWASVLGVDHILEGSVRKAGDALRITAQLIRVEDDSHLWSETYNRELKDIFDLQEDIATAVANELKLTLGIGRSLNQLGGTDNEKAYENYLIAQGLWNDPDRGVIRALEYIDAAIDIDPKFARAWALKASLHNYNFNSLSAAAPIGLADSLREDALYEAQKAVDLDPYLAAGYFSLGQTKMNKGDWIGAESAFQKAFELSDTTMSSNEFEFTARFYISVGYFKKAVDISAEWLRNEPLNASRIDYIHALTCLGDHQQAKEEYENAKELYGDWWGRTTYIYDIMTIRPGINAPLYPVDLDKIDETTFLDRIRAIGIKNFETPEKGLMELRQLYQDEKDLSSFAISFIGIFAAYLGDSDFAMDAMEKAYDRDPPSLQFAWLPVNVEFRQLPRFKEFVREIGLVDYWNKFGWPDLCHKLDNGDFACD